MTPIGVLVTILSYFLLLFIISYWTGRKADNAGFFVGNRKSPWYVVAFAMIGANISGVTYVSVPGMVGNSCFSYLQMVMGFVVGQLVIAFVLTPLFYRMNLISIYGYLEKRFGIFTYKTGACFFFISKMLGAAVRLFLVCAVLQLLVFTPLNLPFALNVLFTLLMVWLYTFQGGVKTLIWTDSLKTFCLVASVVLCIYVIASDMHLGVGGLLSMIDESPLSQVFFWDDVNDKRFFWKQFLAGMFTMIATSGLDQDMMQRNLSCKNFRDAQKNMIVSISMLVIVITLFLMLGVLLFSYAEAFHIELPQQSDNLFPMLATGGYFPVVVGIFFIIGLVSSAYSAAGSALTALTTSFTVDILQMPTCRSEAEVACIRKRVHLGMSLFMGLVVIVIYWLNNTTVLDAVYTLVSYTYGPILGLFAFGIFMRRPVHDRYVPFVALLSPMLCLVLQLNSESWFNGYSFSYELLIFNALFTLIGCCLLMCKETNHPKRKNE